MQDTKIRLGIVGCGVIGGKHLDAATRAPFAQVVAVADSREGAARARADEFGIERVYTDAQLLLDAPDIDAIVLAMPTAGRSGLAVEALRRGKHVLVEKPAAANVGELRHMMEARNGLVVACCTARHRLLPSAKATTDFIGSGALGKLRVLHSRGLGAAGGPPATPRPSWRLSKELNGGGILMNWGCYDLDYLLGITGWSLRPLQVLAQCWEIPSAFKSHVPPESNAETHVLALIRCEGGTLISLERGEYAICESEYACSINGEQGSLRLHMTVGKDKRITHYDSSAEKGVRSNVIWQGDEDEQTLHDGPLHDFVAAIRERRPPSAGLEQALIVQQITDAIYRSASTGQAVDIS